MKIVIFGDSIAEGRTQIEPHESYFLQLQQEFPQHSFINAGVGGNSTREMMMRYEHDVIAQQPNLVIFEPGGNNHDPRKGHEHRQVNDAEFVQLLEKFRSGLPENCRVVIVTFPPIINEQHQFYPLVPGGKLNEKLQTQREIIRHVALENKWVLMDFYQQMYPHRYDLILPDGIHLNPSGHRFFAEKIIETLKNNFPEEFNK